MMKKMLYFASLLCLLFACCFCGYAYENEDFYKGASKGEVINVFNWGEYISDTYEDGSLDINKEFEKLTGIKVNYVTYESNEDLYTKIKNGGASYDIIIPSDYMIERMKVENLLQSFNPEELPNYHYIDEKYKGMYYDENNEYTVPYNVGMVGLIYNTKMVDEKPDSWSIMWDEKYAGKILTFENSRDAFGIAQKLLGYSFNSSDEKELSDVAQLLMEQNSLLQSRVMDEVFNLMETGEAAIAPYYVGDFLTMKEVNPDLDFVFPKEGVNIFVDAICIPKCAQNVSAAKKYINFLLDPEIALCNAFYLGYASPNTAVVENPEYADYANNPLLYPDEEHMPKTEYFHNLPVETLAKYASLWNDIKISGKDNTYIYKGFCVVGVSVVAIAIYNRIKKKKREYWYDYKF